jgi:Transcriptional regulators
MDKNLEVGNGLLDKEGNLCVSNAKNRTKKIPTAIITLADFLAIGTIKALKEAGFKVLEGISVMGFNDEIICAFSDPSLTTVKQAKKLMGESAANLLIDIIEKKEIENKTSF